MSRKMDEVITLDFKQYWGVENTKMRIGAIIAAQRFGAKIYDLPQWVQDKVREAREEEKEEQQFRDIKYLT